MNGIRWGLIGASDIAATRVIGAIRDRGDVVEVVQSHSAARATSFAAEHGIPLGTTSLEELLQQSIDAVYISTTNDRHFSSAVAALSAGKHVLCEKPLALTVSDAREMIALASSTGLVLATNHHLPGSPLHVAVRTLAAEGAIGTLLSARIAHAVLLPERLRGWRLNDTSAGGGVILDITCHDASVLNPLFGNRPIRVSAVAVKQGEWNDGTAADAVMTTIEYESTSKTPILAQTHDAFSVPFAHTRLEVQGTSGTIVVSDAMTQDTPGVVTLNDSQGSRQIDVDVSRDLYSIILDGFGGAIDGTGVPTASGEDGLLALRVALAAQRSVETGRTVEMSEI